METVRFGICGTGSFGRTRAMALQRVAGAVVTLGWSRSQATRDLFGAESGAPTVEHWQELCASPDVDAVLVCSTNVEHFPHARAALAAGKHVLVEIPLSTSSDQARELAKLAGSQSLVLHHGVQQRHHPEYGEHIDQLRRIGSLLYGVEHSQWDYGPRRRWNADPSLNPGARGFLPNYMARWMDAFGEVVRVSGAESRADTWSSASITMDFASGGYATVGYTLGEGVWGQKTELIVGRHGMVSRDAGNGLVLTTAGSERQLTLTGVDETECEVAAFREEILGRRNHLPFLQTDLRALELIDAAKAGVGSRN